MHLKAIENGIALSCSMKLGSMLEDSTAPYGTLSFLICQELQGGALLNYSRAKWFRYVQISRKHLVFRWMTLASSSQDRVERSVLLICLRRPLARKIQASDWLGESLCQRLKTRGGHRKWFKMMHPRRTRNIAANGSTLDSATWWQSSRPRPRLDEWRVKKSPGAASPDGSGWIWMDLIL